jgi:antitoxin (DNA-binding transcriptional repressor) of toxin-antitoxin stability system
MTTLDVTKVRALLSDTLNSVAYKGKRVVLKKHGKALCALVPMEDLELLERLEDTIDLEAARRALADPTEERIPLDKLKADLGL